MKKRKTESSVYHSFSVITQFGIYMLVPILGMSAVGYYLDSRFGSSYWFVVLFFIGAIAGFQNVYRLAMKIASQPSNRKDVSSDPTNLLKNTDEIREGKIGTDAPKTEAVSEENDPS